MQTGMKQPSNSNRTRDQHFVPQLHLKHFRGEVPKNMIWTYSKVRGIVRPSRIQETGFKKNFYSVQDEGGVYFDDIDNMLTDIENRSTDPYHKLLSGEIPTGQERADFSVFLATSFTRSPALIRSFAESSARMSTLEVRMNAKDRNRFDGMIDRIERETGEALFDRDAAFEFINDPRRYTIGISEKSGLKAIGIADKLAPMLFDRHWHVIESVAEPFITCDNPVCRWVPPDSVHPIYGDGGFVNRRAEISYPLSARRLLLLTGEPIGQSILYANTQAVWSQNELRVMDAEDHVFADRKDESITALVKKYKDHRPRSHIGASEANDFEVSITR
jgi:hypothetical protein